MAVTPFHIAVPDSVLDDLNRRLARTRWPDEIPGSGWDYGSNLRYVQELIEYWRTSFDWRGQERMLNSFSHFKADVAGTGVHFIHQKGVGPCPYPLIISHGWPGSFFEMYKVIGPLSDPGKYGGDAEDAFDVIVPSLPGYGFSDRPTEPGMNVARIAKTLVGLMADVLGYHRFAAQGGDWGAMITTWMGHAYPENLIGIHLNLALDTAGPPSDGQMTEEERDWRQRRDAYVAEESGYSRIQGTKPQTLAYGLNDSPAGLAAWIVEKFRTWTDCGGDVESVYTKDELLTNVMIYWVTESINSSTRLYYEGSHRPSVLPTGVAVGVPTGVMAYDKHVSNSPRVVAERTYNIQRWTPMDKGLHFATLETPEEIVQDVRAFFRPLRDAVAR